MSARFRVPKAPWMPASAPGCLASVAAKAIAIALLALWLPVALPAQAACVPGAPGCAAAAASKVRPAPTQPAVAATGHVAIGPAIAGHAVPGRFVHPGPPCTRADARYHTDCTDDTAAAVMQGMAGFLQMLAPAAPPPPPPH